MNTNLTLKIKDFAYSLGSDLVGIANIERFSGAPIMMSPKGIMPTSKSVIVCCIHHPDLSIELGGETHPQDIGPYSVQYGMNSKLDYIAFRVANKLDSMGFDAIPIASSNIWRYRGFMDLEADFAPDMSHIYAATCAGLGQLGWHGMTMTPEYGAWNRFISIITDAPLESTPLYDDTQLCDMCGECIKHCPTDAYRKEVNGVNVIEVEDKQYKFANKNLWRCAWGEHFDLDLDLPIPDIVTEEVIIKTKEKYGARGGEMGCCLKYCLPKELRIDGGDFTSTYIRKKHSYASDLPVHRKLYDRLCSAAIDYSIDSMAILDEKSLQDFDVNLKKYLKTFKSAIVYYSGTKIPDGEMSLNQLLQNHGKGEGDIILDSYKLALNLNCIHAGLDLTRLIDDAGYKSVCSLPSDVARKLVEFSKIGDSNNNIEDFGFILSTAPFKNKEFKNLSKVCDNPKNSLSENLCELISLEGSDLYAAVSADRMDKISNRISKEKSGETLYMASDKNTLHIPFDPIITKQERIIHKPSDYLKNAKSVIMVGIHFPQIISSLALKPPAYAVGPYVFASYQTNMELSFLGYKVCKYLQSKGYKAVMTPDLTGLGGDISSPRGLLNDAVSNSIEAVEAGLGTLPLNGVCYTAAHGFSQRFMAIVTDAPLDEFCSTEEIGKGQGSDQCEECKKCLDACPANALASEKAARLTLCDKEYTWIPVDSLRCEWATKHALCAEEGIKYTGSLTNENLPHKVDEKNLDSALRKSDPVLKARPTIAQRCIIDCPLCSI